MRIPRKPPDLAKILESLSFDKLLAFNSGDFPKLVDGKYLHWDKFRYHKPPDGMSVDEWWVGVKLARNSAAKSLPLTDSAGNCFKYIDNLDILAESLHYIDQHAGGIVQMSEKIVSSEDKNRYLVSSLIQEAITSSQLEGAATTRLVAKDMLRSNRKPRDKNEQMILNNYITMKHLQEIKDEELSIELVCRIHEMITKETLTDPRKAGVLRQDEDIVEVTDQYNEVLHYPPSAGELSERLQIMCDFANGRNPDNFIHPVLRAIILHFWLAYEHPFIDGNGRTARALFYWFMLHNRYWLFEYVSISQIILQAPAKYGRAFLYSETDDNDLTYFLIHQIEIIMAAIYSLYEYMKRKTIQIRELEDGLTGIKELNYRQRCLIKHALKHPRYGYTIRSHQSSHNIVYETARRDLMQLQDKGYLEGKKAGKTWYYYAVNGLSDMLRDK